MIDLQISRSGTLTTITAICDDERIAERVRRVMRRGTSRFTSAPGLTVRVSCSRREAATIEAQIRALVAASTVRVPTFRTAEPLRDRSWRHREVYADDCPVEAVPKTVTVNGQAYRFTGFGRAFMGGELQGPYCGLPCRYAYYA